LALGYPAGRCRSDLPLRRLMEIAAIVIIASVVLYMLQQIEDSIR
jgi:hypothetical protein